MLLLTSFVGAIVCLGVAVLPTHACSRGGCVLAGSPSGHFSPSSSLAPGPTDHTHRVVGALPQPWRYAPAAL